MDAARLAGLNVLGLVNTHAAAALQYGIERDFTKKEQTVSGWDKRGHLLPSRQSEREVKHEVHVLLVCQAVHVMWCGVVWCGSSQCRHGNRLTQVLLPFCLFYFIATTCPLGDPLRHGQRQYAGSLDQVQRVRTE